MKLVVETARDTPLVWYQVMAPGGAAADPVGGEGFAHHMIELARRGAGGRSRAEIDRALDELGASLELSATRDRVALHGVCLSRHLDAVVELAADVLARPAFSADEHRKLLDETRSVIDEVRDDDGALAERHFLREFGGPAPYARTALGTAASLDAIALADVSAAYARAFVRDHLVVGFAGDVDEARARALADRLGADLPAGPVPALPDVSAAPAPGRRRGVLVNKPERTQVQVTMGHTAPALGTADFDALTLVETVFGGPFTSRLMQEIRVQRGWSYGASCRLGRARGPLWFRIDFASAADVAADAVALALRMYEELVAGGVTADELAFAHGYLAGSWPFQIATARSRMRIRTEAEITGIGGDAAMRWHERIAAVTLADTRRAIDAWLRPDSLVTVAVATAADLRERLEATPIGPVEVVDYESY